jgi:Na+/glutamate symporter
VRLITAHRILIGAGIAFFVFYALFQLRLWMLAGATASLAQAVVSVAVAIGLVLYYRTLRRWGRR